MSDEMTAKEALVDKAVKYGLGDEKFLSKMSEENLKNLVSIVESKDGEIDKLKAGKPAEKNPKVVRVSDLVAAKRVKVASIPKEEEEATADPETDEGE